jgi:hypothetical protein
MSLPNGDAPWVEVRFKTAEKILPTEKLTLVWATSLLQVASPGHDIGFITQI